jgi:small neutral amino acid transporter SnatA (MarC family)
MLRAQNPDEYVTEGELNDSKAPARKKKDVAITPLGVPLIGGPCAITNAIALISILAIYTLKAVGSLLSLLGFYPEVQSDYSNRRV